MPKYLVEVCHIRQVWTTEVVDAPNSNRAYECITNCDLMCPPPYETTKRKATITYKED